MSTTYCQQRAPGVLFSATAKAGDGRVVVDVSVGRRQAVVAVVLVIAGVVALIGYVVVTRGDESDSSSATTAASSDVSLQLGLDQVWPDEASDEVFESAEAVAIAFAEAILESDTVASAEAAGPADPTYVELRLPSDAIVRVLTVPTRPPADNWVVIQVGDGPSVLQPRGGGTTISVRPPSEAQTAKVIARSPQDTQVYEFDKSQFEAGEIVIPRADVVRAVVVFRDAAGEVLAAA